MTETKEQQIFIPTFINDLDDKIQGIPEKSITLILGGPGTYKTTFSFYILYKNIIERGNLTGLFITVEQSPESLVQQLKNFGFDLEKIKKDIYIRDMGKAFPEIEEQIEEMSEGMMKATEDILFSGQPDIISENKKKNIWKEIIKLVLEHKEANFIVIDSLSALLSFIPVDYGYRVILNTLFNSLKTLNKTVFVIMEKQSLPDDRMVNAIASYIADNVFEVFIHELPGKEGRRQRRLRILKMRFSDHPLNDFVLYFDSKTASFKTESLEGDTG